MLTWKRHTISEYKDKLWEVLLEECEVKEKLLRAIQALYDGGMACVKVGECS